MEHSSNCTNKRASPTPDRVEPEKLCKRSPKANVCIYTRTVVTSFIAKHSYIGAACADICFPSTRVVLNGATGLSTNTLGALATGLAGGDVSASGLTGSWLGNLPAFLDLINHSGEAKMPNPMDMTR
jgi:hypothetical protein